MLAQFKSRLKDFNRVGRGLLFAESTAGVLGDDWDVETKRGQFFEWSVYDEIADAYFPLLFSHKDKEGKHIGGIIFPERGETEKFYDIPTSLSGLTYKSPLSEKTWTDSPETRREWNKGKYVCRNPEADPRFRTYHWTGLVCDAFTEIAQDYLEAVNHFKRYFDNEPLKTFYQLRLAQPWEDTEKNRAVKNLLQKVEVTNLEKEEGELDRFCVVDLQGQPGEHYFFVLIASVFSGKKIKILHYDKVEKLETIWELTEKYGITSNRVVFDRTFNPNFFVSQIQYDKSCFSFKGETKDFKHFNKKTKQYTTKHFSTVQYEKYKDKNLVYFSFNANACKDILWNLYCEKLISVPENISPLFMQQFLSEEKKEVSPGVYEWEKKKRRNDAWDCSVMLITFCLMLRLFER